MLVLTMEASPETAPVLPMLGLTDPMAQLMFLEPEFFEKKSFIALDSRLSSFGLPEPWVSKKLGDEHET